MIVDAFELDDYENDKADVFIEKHKECLIKKKGKFYLNSASGDVSFIFTNGNTVEIRCNACGKVENITNPF